LALILPQSDVPGIVWPTLTSGTPAGRMLALQQQLNETQWLDPDVLRRRQFLQLNQLLAHAHRESPFYHQRLEAVGYRPGQRVTEDFWAGIPRLTRSDIHGHGESLRCRRMPSHHGPTHRVFSTGSTGKPITAYQSQISQFFWSAFTLRDHFWHNRDFSGSAAAIRFTKHQSAAEGTTSEDWGRSVTMLTSTGPGYELDIGTPVERQAEWLRQRNPDYLLTHATNLTPLPPGPPLP
jgi:phenylacetate-CoA ligase